jgi:hypothetical protein
MVFDWKVTETVLFSCKIEPLCDMELLCVFLNLNENSFSDDYKVPCGICEGKLIHNRQ